MVLVPVCLNQIVVDYHGVLDAIPCEETPRHVKSLKLQWKLDTGHPRVLSHERRLQMSG